MALGDGYIDTSGGLSIRHCIQQEEYIRWKRSLLVSAGVKCNECKIISNGVNDGIEFRTYGSSFGKVIRKVLYKPHKIIANRKLLNKLTPLDIAIWYMDDGGLSQKKRNGIVYANELMINTGIKNKDENQIIIDYFAEVWNIHFNQYKNKHVYRLACSTREARKFVKIVERYVKEVPSMIYKINVKPESERTKKILS